MATTYKILGQVQGTAGITTYADLYTVPSATSAVVSTVSVCNTASADATIRIAVAAGSTPTAAEWVVYGATVAANDTLTLTLGITMEATKKLVISSSANTVSFSAFGSEIS
jgi:hypothetical protein